MVRKIFAVLMFSFGIAVNAFAGGCRCSDRHDIVSADDQVFNFNRVCDQYNMGYRLYSAEGSVLYCTRNRVGDNGCGCSHYVYSWNGTPGSCVGGKSAGDLTIKWLPNPWAYVCWQPLCRTEKQYWQGQLKKGTVDYTKCSACRLRYVELVDADPTEYSYVKVVPDPSSESGCVSGAKIDNTCIGYKVAEGRQEDSNCVTKGCRCTRGTATEYKGTDDDWYVKCG